MRYEVNASSGAFVFPETIVGFSGAVDQRIRVHQDDLDPALNAGARYFVESQYVVDNDALAGNGLNNASYREVNVAAGTLNLSFAAATVREKSAIHAWPVVDPSVELVNADMRGGSGVNERFEVARRVTFANGVFTTVVAVHNLNSDLAARALRVDYGALSPTISNPSFHGVDNHSGEFAAGQPGNPALVNTAWAADTGSLNGIVWSTDDFVTDPAANALRWSSTFTFSFDSNIDPTEAAFSLDFYKPSSPSSVEIPFVGTSTVIFLDGFESGSTSSWSSTSP
jgi:hypothetical protein